MKFCCLAFITLFFNDANCQFKIKGFVADENGTPLSGILITIKTYNKNLIQAFTESDLKGEFTLFINTKIDKDSLYLVGNAINYSSKKYPIQTNFVKITCFKKITILPEIKVKNRPITQAKDTLKYNAISFKRPNDLVLAEILDRLPGIEITNTGQIKYQGKAINRFYIEGLNLLDDKYVLASNNLPANGVKEIQILENHQPIKLLDSTNFSNRAAINIILNNDAKNKIIGSTNIGGGIENKLIANVEITPMKFGTNKQEIYVGKYNNSGNTIANEIALQNEKEIFNNIKAGIIPTFPLYQPNVNNAFIPSTRIVFNNDKIFSFNRIKKINNNRDLKLLIDGSFSNQTNEINTVSFIFLPLDTITIKENKNKQENNHFLRAILILEENKTNYYLKNEFRLQTNFIKNNLTIQNLNNLNTLLNSSNQSINNSTNLITKKGSLWYGLNSLVSYSSSSQKLNIIDNSLLAFNSNAFQNFSLKNFFTNTIFFLKKKINNYLLEAQFAAQIGNYNLSTALTNADTLVTDFKNISNSLDVSLSNTIGLTYNYKKTKLQIGLPFEYVSRMNNQNGAFQKKIFFNYNFDFIYKLNINFNIQLNASTNNSLPQSWQMYNNNILLNYRVIKNNLGLQQHERFRKQSITLNYKNTQNAFFGSLSFDRNNTKNTLINNKIFDGFITYINPLFLGNQYEDYNMSLTLSKYIQSLYTNLQNIVGYINSTEQQSVNNKPYYAKNKKVIIQNKIQSRFKMVSFTYQNIIQFNSLYINEKQTSNFILLKNLAIIDASFKNAISLHLHNELFSLKDSRGKNETFFCDFFIRKKIKKYIFEFSISNIFNNTQININSIFNQNQEITNINLRNRIFLSKIILTF